MMTQAEYLAEAERFARAAETAVDPIERSQLEVLANSYSILARSTAVLDRSGKILEALERQHPRGGAIKASSVGGLVYARDCHPGITSLKVGPDIGAAGAAALTYEARLNVRKPDLVRPRSPVQSDVVAAVAIDQDSAQAHRPHLAEGDFHLPAVGVGGSRAASGAGHERAVSGGVCLD
ncbi:hypothetical protein [Bradyrhizobium sp. CB1015]|uniref:hypothetical protein n=1 Tax=Bradyrhizobium sp. CB1015 TaxID=2976822 RepID=UPI00288B2024|nr:hypothetical protein [Bradyrhizobium sp. CB1015]